MSKRTVPECQPQQKRARKEEGEEEEALNSTHTHTHTQIPPLCRPQTKFDPNLDMNYR